MSRNGVSFTVSVTQRQNLSGHHLTFLLLCFEFQSWFPSGGGSVTVRSGTLGCQPLSCLLGIRCCQPLPFPLSFSVCFSLASASICSISILSALTFSCSSLYFFSRAVSWRLLFLAPIVQFASFCLLFILLSPSLLDLPTKLMSLRSLPWP